MSAHQALDIARAAGIEVRAEGMDLVLTVPDPTPEAVIDVIRRNKASILVLLADPAAPWTAESWQAYLRERTVLLQVDHELTPAQARALAFETCVMEWLARNPINTTDQVCCHCSASGKADDPLLAVGIGGRGEAWLHRACVAAWRVARRAEAISALASLGLATPSAEAPFSVPPTIDKLVLSPRG